MAAAEVQQIAVVIYKPSGRVLFSRCANDAAAMLLIDVLTGLGLKAEIDNRTDLPARPGSYVSEAIAPSNAMGVASWI